MENYMEIIQMLLESEHDTHASARQQRLQQEDIAKQIEQLHSATESDLKLHMEKGGSCVSHEEGWVLCIT